MNEIEYINQEKVKKSINKLANVIRAERSDSESYYKIYADKSILDRLVNRNNQIIYGRRGTGKTHLLFALQELIFSNNSGNDIKEFPIYFDLRKFLPLLTSSSSVSLENAILIFQTIINETVEELIKNFKYIFDISDISSPTLFEQVRLEKIKEQLQKLNIEFNGREFKRLGSIAFSKEEVRNIATSLNISQEPSLSFDLDSGTKKSFSQESILYVSFSEISKSLTELSSLFNNVRVTCLLDEWSEIPLNLQPYVAELLKRVFIASNYTLKIAAIPYRSKFRDTIHDDIKIGLEEGGDIFPISIDNRFIFEVDKNGTRNFYNEILINHMKQIDSEIFEDVDENRFVNYFFANQALSEILIASAGIPRDFMNLFILAYNNRTNLTQRIILKNIRNSTTQWYTSDKKEEIDKDPTTRHLFEELVNQVILVKKKTHFLLPQKYSENSYVKKLIDLRVLHLRQKGISHRHITNKTYDVYSIDYGSYTSLAITKSSLNTDFNELIGQLNTISDIRSARSLSIEDDFFERFNLETGQGIKCNKCSKTIDMNHAAYIKQNICNHCFEKVE